MKRILGLILAIVLIVTMLPSVMAASVPTMTMSSSSGHDVGDVVTLTISFDYGDNKIKSIAMDSFTYDKNVLKLNSLSWEIGGFLATADPDGDSLIAFTSATKVTGVVMKAEVEVIGQSSDLTQEITFNSLVTPETGSNITVAVTGGVITLNPTELTGTQTVVITAPVKGATPQNTIAAGTGYTGTIAWEGNPAKFAANTVYAANITLTAASGYIFDNDATGNVAGATITNNSVSNDGSKLTFKATFPKTAGKDTPICVAPANVTATYGQTLADITLNNPSGNTPGTWSWMTPSTSVGNASTTPVIFKAKFVPTDGDNYATVENIDVPVIVNAKNITVSIATISDQEYTGSQIKPTVVVTGDGKTLKLDTDYTVEYGANVNVGANAGSVTVKAKTNGNYTFTNVVKNFNIVAKAGTVSISGNLNVTFGTAVPDITINKNGSDGATTTYYYTNAACTEGKTTTKPTAAGNYWVQVEMAAGTNFGAAVSNALSFTISRADITPEVTITGWTYKTTANEPSVTGNTGNGAVTYKYKAKNLADSAYSTTVPTNAGEYTVKAEIAETSNYNAGSATANFTIAPKALDSTMVAATIAPQPYTGSEIKPTPAVTDGTALVNKTDFTYAYEDNTYVGTAAKVKVVGQGNYSGEIVKEFSITVADQTPAITATASVTKGGNTVDLKPLVANAKGDVTFTISGEANGCSIDNGVLTSGENSGTVKINVAITAKDVNGDTVNEYNAYFLADAITVTINDKETQDTLNITSATTVTFGHTLTLTSVGGSGTGAVTYAVTNGTGEATIDGNVLTPSKVGTVTVIATKAEDTTYNSISSAPVVITIEKIKVAIPAEDTTVYTYTGTEQTYQIDENAAYTIAGNKQTNANEAGYPVTVTLNDTETHAWADDSIEAKNYTFIINKATITVTAKNQQVYVNGTAPVLGTEHYTVTGLVNGETLKTAPTIEYETTPDTSATGSVVIKVYGAEAPDGGNYNDVVHTNGTLTIKKKSSGGGSISVSKYTVKFETNGGSAVENKTVNRNTVLEAPEAPTKDGFKFDGWFTDKELTTAYDFTAKVTKGFTLYAKWTEIEKKPEVEKSEDKDDPEATEWKNPFEDVKENDWFYANVQYVVENKLMNGVATDKFAPNDILTRAMLVTVLYRNEGEPAVNKSIPFVDIDMGEYYASAVIWAKQNGIVNGVTETEFAPDENITREQIAAIMFRYAQYNGMDAITLEENLHFDDANEISEYAVSAMNWAVGTGLMKGKSTTTINPKDNATRAEIAAILQRYTEANK
ncbi:MAG: S-layer homology domain-containing protein [Lachnospira sp.]|nr:S-layer homology domain-containing protein [Lachnospira sp.]